MSISSSASDHFVLRKIVVGILISIDYTLCMMPGLRGAVTEDHLSRLVAQTHQAVLQREDQMPLGQLLRRVRPSDRYFHSALAQERFHLVGEFKSRCPIEGDLRAPSDVTSLLNALENRGSALAVHCSEMYGGSPQLLKRLRSISDLPMLCASLIIRPYQVVEARVWGADAVLLMPSLVEQRVLGELMSQARILNMAAVVLVHDEAELDAALRCRARIIAVGGRVPHTLKVDHERMSHLLDKVPSDRVRLAVGGFHSRDQLTELREEIDGVMIGTALMKAAKPTQMLRRLGF